MSEQTGGTPLGDSPPHTDAELLAAHCAGDPDAFAEIVRRHKDRLWAVALRTTGNPEEASDALPVLDLRAMVLPVLKANEQELAAHDAVLADLDKSSGGKTIWRIGKDAAQAVT